MSTAPVNFQSLGLSAPILQALKDIGYESPSPIQAAAIPCLQRGLDIVGQAQTGTGKTAAFALPLLSQLDIHVVKPQVLVLTPTRELAIQVAEAFQAYARHLKGFHVLPIYGGQNMGTQLRSLKRGAHVIIGTPGRIMDHLRRKTLTLDAIKSLVLDEADEMLNMGFLEDVEWIFEQTPTNRQVALFSATMPKAIRDIAQRHLRNPEEVKIKTATATVTAIEQSYWPVRGVHKLDALTRILETEDFDAVLIFVRTKSETVELAEKLEARGYAAAALNGDMKQSAREQTVEQLKNSTLDIVVATDVAARGLDVQRITHVVNYDIPYDTEAYVHRIGRTGRAGRKGRAILFVTPKENRMLRMIEKATRQQIERMELPSKETVANRRVEKFKQKVMDIVANEDLNYLGGVIDRMESEHAIDARDIAAALAFLLQGKQPLQVAVKEAAFKSDIPAKKEREKSTRHTDQTRDATKSRKDFDSRKQSHDDKAQPLKKFPEIEMVRYRIEVGREHGATPKDIVGAIANEADIESQYIGHIKLYDDYSTVDLPDGMPKELFQHLKKVRVRQQKLNISLAGGDSESAVQPLSQRKKPQSGSKKPASKRKPKQAAKKQRSN
ncbi:DEAD/DEAH box helicase [Kaarinaea lacus]